MDAIIYIEKMSILDCLLIILVVFLFYILYLSETKQSCKEKSNADITCTCSAIPSIQKEKLEEPKDTVDPKTEPNPNPNLGIIEDIVDEYQSPFYRGNVLDINSKLSIYHSSYGSRDRDTKIGNHNMVYVKELNKIHNPLMNYYENRNWFERNTEHDFDMFLK